MYIYALVVLQELGHGSETKQELNEVEFYLKKTKCNKLIPSLLITALYIAFIYIKKTKNILYHL